MAPGVVIQNFTYFPKHKIAIFISSATEKVMQFFYFYFLTTIQKILCDHDEYAFVVSFPDLVVTHRLVFGVN